MGTTIGLARSGGRGATKRHLLVFALVLGGLLAGAALLGEASAQVSSERVVATPGEGTLQTRFHFAGSGFAPGRTVSVRVYCPDGSERRFINEEGAELVWLVDANGTFTLDLVPGQRFPGCGLGHWRTLFCSQNSPTCQLVEIDVLP